MTIGLGSYCALHTRIIYNKAFEWFTSLPKRLGEKWPLFYSKVQSLYAGREETEVPIDDFETVCQEFDINIEKIKNIFLEAFPGSINGNKKCIDMSHLAEIFPASEIRKIYNKVDLSTDDEEEMGDFSGYTGVKIRDVKDLEPYTYDEFVRHVIKDNKLPLILKSIRDIDQDNNGYVTTTELEDIIKFHYPSLQNKKVKHIMKQFASIQNRILIDYKTFRKDLIERIKLDFEDGNQKKDETQNPRPTNAVGSPRRLKNKLNSLTVGSLAKLGNFDTLIVRRNT